MPAIDEGKIVLRRLQKIVEEIEKLSSEAAAKAPSSDESLEKHQIRRQGAQACEALKRQAQWIGQSFGVLKQPEPKKEEEILSCPSAWLAK